MLWMVQLLGRMGSSHQTPLRSSYLYKLCCLDILSERICGRQLIDQHNDLGVVTIRVTLLCFGGFVYSIVIHVG